ncbi:MAG: cation:proton antiporter [Rudaea sp.]
MTIAQAAALLVVLTAVFAYLNARLLRLPGTIGIMLIALAASLVLLVANEMGLPLAGVAQQMLRGIDFNRTLMGAMLGFLLFAGALEVDLQELAQQRWPVAFLAVVGVLLSTFLVGTGTYVVFALLGRPIPWLWCLVFGALISPTDPIAVLAIIRKAGASKSLELKVAGESLFNDGVGIVVFLELLGLATGNESVHIGQSVLFFLREALGGVAFGMAIGFAAFLMLRRIDNYNVEVLITVALVVGGYSAAEALEVSAPIAIVVAGLIVGNYGRAHAMSQQTRAHLDTFWGLIDAMLNGVLFVMIGLEVLVLPLDFWHLVAAAVAIPIVLLARFASVGIPALLPLIGRCFDFHTVKVLTWGGLRGGISIALALSLPATADRDTLVMMTYGCALFAIAVQGLTVGRLVSRRR